MLDTAVAAAREAVLDIEEARRDTRRAGFDFWEAIYQAYLAGFALAAVITMVGAFLPDDELTGAAVSGVASRGPAILGGVVAIAVYAGLRSGARGGPLVFEAPTVQYVLQSPVDRAFVARRAAIGQLRTAALWGTLGGAAAGIAISASIPANWIGLAAGFAAVGALGGIALVSVALIASGIRLSVAVATSIGLLAVAWSAVDILWSTTTSPLSLLGRIGLAELAANPFMAIGVLVVAALAAEGYAVSGGFSLEASRRRAGLVSQIRFALTMQDLRTVVLLRRRMTQTGPRARPWIPLQPSRGNRLPVLRRSLQSLVRMPIQAALRLLVLSVAAGVALGFAAEGLEPLALLSGLLLFVAAYDALEPLAQEVDNPTRWVSYPRPPGEMVTRLTAAGALSLVPVALVAAGVASLVGPAEVIPVAFVVFPCGAVAAAFGAAVSTLMGAPDPSRTDNAFNSEIFGMFVVIRLALPPALAVAPFLAATATLATGGPIAGLASNALIVIGISCGIAWAWLGSRSPGRL